MSIKRISVHTKSETDERVLEEAKDILGRILTFINSGEFRYVSPCNKGMFLLNIRPMREELVCEQPFAHQYVDFHQLTYPNGISIPFPGRHLARFHL
jgi:hypothetical protein